jgi:chaperonin cofactor prefoldin
VWSNYSIDPPFLYSILKQIIMSGLLSQALANLKSAEAQITALAGLPAGAVSVQTDSANLINGITPQVNQLQALVNDFVQKSIPQLHTIETAASNNISIEQLKDDLLVVHNEAGVLKSSLDGITTKITDASNHIASYSNALTRVDSELNTQITNLQSQIGNAQGRADAAKKKYYYLIGLAPLALFGAPAMIAAATASLVLSSQIDGELVGYHSKVSDLNNQISRLNMMKSADQQLRTDFLNLRTKISGLQNSISFLIGDITNEINNIDQNGSRLLITFFVNATLTEVLSLQSDAS